MPDYSKTKIQLRRGTSAEWNASSVAGTILGKGEPGYDTSSGVLKVGNGTGVWNSLSAITGGGGGGGGISDVVEDTTPQLGGDLDLNSNNVTGTGDMTITGTVTATAFKGELQSANGSNRVILGTALTANADGNDHDILIKGDNDQNLFRTDAGNDRVGIGTHSPQTKLDVNGTMNATTITQNSKSVPNSDATGITNASGVTNIVQMTQAAYNALGSYDATTLYYIV